jgi:DNA-binding NarL/FixJ family response regulator
MPDASQPAAARKAYRSMTVSMSTRAIELVNQGLSNRAIAAELGVSERSVKRNIVVQRARAALKARRGEALPGRKLKSGDIEAYSDFDGDPER